MKMQKSLPPLSKRKELIFKLTSIAIPFILLLILEISLRLCQYGENYNVFIDIPDERFKDYKACNINIAGKYFSREEGPQPRNDIFRKKKGENSFRIFVLGESSAAGFPYGFNLMFSRILHERLQQLYPHKEIEMVSLALTAVNSYTMLDFTREIMREKPNALLIYAGHNEYYGALGVGSLEGIRGTRALKLLHLRFLKLRTYQLMQKGIQALAGDKKRDEVLGTLMTRIVRHRDIGYNSKIYKAGIRQFEANMSSILSMARSKGVEVFIGEQVCNIKDLSPFSSPENADNPKAIDVFQKAKAMEKAGLIDSARFLYYYAKDLDGVRFRAPEALNDVIHKMAGKFKAHLVPMKSFFEEKSPNGLIGKDLMTEHVHPTPYGYFLMADAFYSEIIRSGIIDAPFAANHQTLEYQMRHYGYTPIDSLIGQHKVNFLMLHWPFQPLDAPLPDYHQLYRPSSFADSVAFDFFKKGGSEFYQAHQVMARHFEQEGQYKEAGKEYLAAIAVAPFNMHDYSAAIRSYVKINDYTTATRVAREMVKTEETFHGLFFLGGFELLRFDYHKALDLYQRAEPLATTDIQRKNLYEKQFLALVFDGQNERAKIKLNKIKKIDPSYRPAIPNERKHISNFVPDEVKELVKSGYTALMAGKKEEALAYAQTSLTIRESPLANRIAGEALLTMENPDAINYLWRAAPDYPVNLYFQHNLTLACIKAGMKQEALQTLNRIKRFNPSFESIPQLESLIHSMGKENKVNQPIQLVDEL